MIQKTSVLKQAEDPDEHLYIQLTTQLAGMESRVESLESKSGAGREELRAGLDALKADVEAIRSGGSGSLEDAGARVTAAEKQLVDLEGTVTAGNAELRETIDGLKEKYDGVSRAVGDRVASSSSSSSLLEVRSEQAGDIDDAAAGDAAGDAAVGSTETLSRETLTARCTALEGRVEELEAESNQGRGDLTTDLEALDKDVDAMVSGGLGSLEHTTGRVTSTERQVTSLQAAVDGENGGMKTDLENLEAKVDHLRAKVGASGSLIQVAFAQEPANAAAAAPTKLPLTSRVYALNTRIAQLEEKSDQGRGDLREKLQLLTEKVGDMKSVGVESLEHTTLRVGSAEGEIDNLNTAVGDGKANLDGVVQALGDKLDSLASVVGAT